MSDTDTDLDAELGIQAFQDMARAMDRLGTTLKAVDHRQQIRLADEEQEASSARKAASQATQAANMAQEAAQTALRASRAEIRSSLLWTGCGALAVLLLAAMGGFYLGRSQGWDQGQAAGYASARTEAAATSWANTPNGRRAWELDRLGSLDMLLTCSNQGWRTERQNGNRVCFPGTASDGKLYGWTLP